MKSLCRITTYMMVAIGEVHQDRNTYHYFHFTLNSVFKTLNKLLPVSTRMQPRKNIYKMHVYLLYL